MKLKFNGERVELLEMLETTMKLVDEVGFKPNFKWIER